MGSLGAVTLLCSDARQQHLAPPATNESNERKRCERNGRKQVARRETGSFYAAEHLLTAAKITRHRRAAEQMVFLSCYMYDIATVAQALAK